MTDEAPVLRRIEPTAYQLTLTGEMLAQQNPVESLTVNLEQDTSAVFPETPLTLLDELIEGISQQFEAGDTEMDRTMVVELHRALPIPRRLAAERRIWHYLGLIRYPQFVCHRWPMKPGKDGIPRRQANRFLGDRVRNTFARLWWLAELTKDEDGEYDLTLDFVNRSGFQDQYEAFFGRAFCGYRPALQAFIEETRDVPEAVVREVARAFGRVMSTVVLESLVVEDLRQTVRRLIAESSRG